jgi:EAL domain-containing protein (putative c-di-GMP-specific phosphodiesterase class I)/ABC-type amino acid transport substrate-binding protein
MCEGQQAPAYAALLPLVVALLTPSALVAQEPPLLFGGASHYPPFHFRDAGGQATGFDVEVLQAIAQQRGLDIDYRFDDWSLIQDQLSQGQIDVVPMFISTARQQLYLFSDIINLEHHLVFGGRAAESISGIASLAGLRVSSEGGSFAMSELERLGVNAQLVEADSEADALRKVLRGDADVALLPAGIGRYTIAAESLEGIEVLSPPLFPVSYAFAVHPSRAELITALNDGMATLQREGVLEALRERWLRLPQAVVSDNAALEYALWIVSVLGFISLLAAILLWNHRVRDFRSLDEKDRQLMADLRKALSGGKLSWVFQPQYSVLERRISGAEMLIRWQHPERGWVPPDQFIVLAEKTGLIKAITREVLRQAFIVLRDWQAAGHEYKLSINVSANDLADRKVVERIGKDLLRCGGYLTVEITETAIMQDIKAILANVETLRRAQVKISLDDYGTGYSSLESLKALHFDEIKIDKTFISDIAQSERNLKLAQASITMGHELGASIVAEGVEDHATIGLLEAAGCDHLQGYCISRPLALDDFVQFAKDFDTATSCLNLPTTN